MKSIFLKIIRVLEVIFWILLVISLILAVLSIVPAIAVYIRLLQLAGGSYLGYHGPLVLFVSLISLIMTNLWWLLLLLAPSVALWRSKPLVGFSISVIAALSLWLVPPLIINRQSKQLLANEYPKVPESNKAISVNSVQIPEDGCDDFCQRLLLGGDVKTVRTSNLPHGKRLIFKLDVGKNCQKFDPELNLSAHCILAQPDDGKTSELVLEHKFKGERRIKRNDLGFSPKLISKEQLILRQSKTKKIVAVQVRLKWTKPVGYVPLYTNTGFDGRGIHGGGLVPRQKVNEDPKIEQAALFEKLGIAIVKPRKQVGKSKSESYSYINSNEYYEKKPFDLALIRSVMEADGLESKTSSYFIANWLRAFSRNNFLPTSSEGSLIADLLAQPASNKRIFLRELNAAISVITVKQTPEENEIYAKAYLEAMPQYPKVDFPISAIGRFTFDPTPHLQAIFKKIISEQSWRAAEVIGGACNANQRWGAKIGPFMLEAIGTYSEVPRVSNKPYENAVSRAITGLKLLGQKNALAELEMRMGSNVNSQAQLDSYCKKQNARKPDQHSFDDSLLRGSIERDVKE